ncbi:sugar nucleotide-binding protein [Streptomyces sp. NPDC057239]|uniref:sugar nucleotide-binding protein n=1 Tax=Streptomyces sp. NPDC057239 TaxID=3346061 RepID=UPI0036455F24
MLTAPAVRYPVAPRADVRRTAIQGYRKDTGNIADPLGADRCARTLPASGAPRSTTLNALTGVGTLDDLELGHLRPESTHGDGHDPCCSADRTKARDELGHRPRHDSAEAVARHRDHPTDPRTACSRSGLSGERAVTEGLPDVIAVVRTPWLYGLHGTNFVRTMISLESRRPTVDVLDDQRGQPTRSADAAERTAGLGARLDDGAYGPPPVRDRKSAQQEALPLIRKELSQ